MGLLSGLRRTCRLVFMVIIFMICSWAGRIRWPMDGSVNSSLGAQIAAQLRGLPVGTCIVAVRICWESLVFERFLGIHGPERGVQPGPLWADPVLMVSRAIGFCPEAVVKPAR